LKVDQLPPRDVIPKGAPEAAAGIGPAVFLGEAVIALVDLIRWPSSSIA